MQLQLHFSVVFVSTKTKICKLKIFALQFHI